MAESRNLGRYRMALFNVTEVRKPLLNRIIVNPLCFPILGLSKFGEWILVAGTNR